MTIRSASRNVIVDPSLATLAELIDRIAAADQLPKRTRRDWTWALNAIARAAGTDPRAVRAHPVYLRPVLKRAAPESIGIGRDAWKNVRSLSGKALTWAGLATPPTRFQASLTPSWTALRDKLSDRGLRMRLSRFFHFCSAQGIAPSEVNNHVLTLFYDSLLVERNLRDPREARRVTAKSWNNAAERIPGWPQQRLLVPSLRRIFSLQWGAFPTGLEADVEEYLRRAAGSDLLDEAFMHALRPATIHSRRAQLRYFATAVVKSGVDIDTLVNLPAILVPEIAARALQYLIDRNGGTASSHISDIAEFLPTLARRLDMDSENVGKLRRVAKKVRLRSDGPTPRRRRGMAPRNRAALRRFDDPAAVEALVTLPQRILQEVLRSRRKGYREAKMIQTALAAELLLNAPVRIQNLASIEIARHIVEVGGAQNRAFHLHFPAAEVKNSNDLEFPLMPEAATLLGTYLINWRPVLTPGSSEFLFPGEKSDRHKCKIALSAQIKKLVYAYTGLEMPAHRFRHAVGKIYLDRNPGQYEIVRLLLGHKDIETTTAFYTGAESVSAVRHYHHVILGLRHNSLGSEHQHV